jgi:hypothetical protein
MPLSRWATTGEATTLLLEREGETWVHVAGRNVPLGYYVLEEYQRGEGLRGAWAFIAFTDADAIQRVEERVAAGYYTPTAAKNPPKRLTA